MASAMPLVPSADCCWSLASIPPQSHCRQLYSLKRFDKFSDSRRFSKELKKSRRSVDRKQLLKGIPQPTVCFPSGLYIRRPHDRHAFTALASANDNSSGFKRQEDENVDREQKDTPRPYFARLKESLVAGTRRYMNDLSLEIESDAGVDLDAFRRARSAIISYLEERRQELVPSVPVLQRKLNNYSSQALEVWNVVKLRYWPQFVLWNRWELWKDTKRWDVQRSGALIMYVLVIAASLRSLHIVFVRPRIIKHLANAYLEAVIPLPNPENLRKLRKAMWRQKMPEGFRMERYVHGTDGKLDHDKSFIGENPWGESDDEEFPSNSDELMEKNPDPTQNKREEVKSVALPTDDALQKKRSDADAKMTWQERLDEWDKMIRLENLKEHVKSVNSAFVIPVNLEELKNDILKERAKQNFPKRPRAYLVARKWWQYRPKLPYMYFLSKVRKFEVEEAVYTEDTKTLFVKMKDGFPADYMVDIPVDPYLFDLLRNCNVELDVLPKSDWYYYLRALAVLAPSLIILFFIRQFTVRVLESSSEKISDLLKMDRKHLILPENAAQNAKSEYKDVVVGDNVWEVLEEVMAYMKEPMRYYSKKLFLPRGILISGPPGTGKTLLARALARESGHPFVFASGAEFVESGAEDGAEKVFNIFFTARANAPSFVFIDEIDALAGKGVKDDPERRSTFDQLLAELDGLPEDTDVDRFSLRQAVVLICATNRADDLDERLLKPGRVDREIYLGLPGEEERVDIFKVHSAGRRLAKDVDFSKLVFRTVGYSGADIRNLVNEAGIMAVRKRRSEICQQDIVDVLDKQLFEGLGMVLTEEEQALAEKKVSIETKRLLAVHEAGHILLSHLFPSYDWHAFTHLLPGGKESALSLFYPRQEMLGKGYTTVGYLKMQMVVAHGGRCAERIVFGDDITDGGQDDLAKISKIAREIVISFASPRLGLFPLVWKDKFDPPLPSDEPDLIPNNWSRPGNRIANMSMEVSELFTREVTRYVEEAEEEAMKGLLTNRQILDRIVIELLGRTKMSGLELAEMIKSMNPVMFRDHLEHPLVESDLQERRDPPNRVGRYEYLDIFQAPLHSC